MSANSNIEWTDATWNPIRGAGPNRWMCQKISPGCDNCYASTMNHRFGGQEYKPGYTGDVRLDYKALMLPLTWTKPRRIFVCSMTDLFGEWVPNEWITQIFGAMALADWHQFQVLTKRPSRMRSWLTEHRAHWATDMEATAALAVSYEQAVGSERLAAALRARLGLDDFGPWPLPNVWLGTSIELDRFSWRANVLRNCPAVVRFISAEPLIGPLPSLDLTGIDWLIAGGESGSHHRPMELDWVRDLRDRSTEAGTAFFFKQWGGRTHAESGRILDGRTWSDYPQPAPVLVPA